MADLEDALKKLDKLTQEEARMALAEVLGLTDSVHNEVKVVDRRVESVDNKVEVVGSKVEDIGDKVQCVDDKVQVVIDGAQGLSDQLKTVTIMTSILSDGKQARVAVEGATSIIQQTASRIDEIKGSCLPTILQSLASCA